MPRSLHEPTRETRKSGDFDVIVCGGGPAGIAAAISAGRSGARVLLLENQGCLGGVWTAGCLTWIIDHENKSSGLMPEILSRLESSGGRAENHEGPSSGFDPEVMKVVLDAMCLDAGVVVRFHTRVVAALRDPSGERLTHVITESKSGREAWAGKVFIDCTGDGDLGALAGCGFDMGHPADGSVQPLSMLAILTGPAHEDVAPYLSDNGLPWGVPHEALRGEIARSGTKCSYSYPTLFRLTDGLYMLMANHQYGVMCDDADAISAATIEARRELFEITSGLKSLGGIWRNLKLVATSAQIGIREGRRIHGLYTVSADDVTCGARHDDAVCRATFCVDIHSTNPEKDKGLGNGGVKSQPYDIPLRALIAKDVDGLLMAGRCISGDFWAHGSYRVTGNAVAMGEAAGKFAADVVRKNSTPHRLVLAPESPGQLTFG
jgi:hypothetical protein